MSKGIHKETFAYVAGLIDGEGYVSLIPIKSSPDSYKTVVKVASCDGIMAPFLQSKFGGHVSHRITKQHNANDSMCWQLSGQRQVREFLINILPYLKVKKQQAENVISYIDNCSLRKTYDKHTNTYTIKSEVLVLRREHYNRARLLNKRGLALAETKWEDPYCVMARVKR